METVVRRKVLVIVGQGNETVTLMKTGFMQTAGSPLPRTFESTTDTLTTSESKRASDIATLNKSNFARCSLPGSDWSVARHCRGGGLEPDATTHDLAQIGSFRAPGLLAEFTGGLLLVGRTTPGGTHCRVLSEGLPVGVASLADVAL